MHLTSVNPLKTNGKVIINDKVIWVMQVNPAGEGGFMSDKQTLMGCIEEVSTDVKKVVEINRVIDNGLEELLRMYDPGVIN
jgi:hypothetical protein